MKELDPLIKRLCDHYEYDNGKFVPVYDEASSKWIVTFSKGWEFLNNDIAFTAFYWTSDDSIENFLDQLKDFFFSLGHDAGKYY